MVCKVAPKVSASALGPAKNETDQTLQVADYETALDSAGYGHLSRAALGACSCAFFATGVENCVMSYVLPAARCELSLTTYQSALVNIAFMCGGVASAFFWGIVGDVFGRRNTISLTLLLNAAITLGQSTVTDYRYLLAARSINGFLIGAPSTLTFTYLSDLVGTKKRQFYLNTIGSSFVIAWLILPAIAWLVIPFKISNPTALPIYSWRLYLVLGSIPGFLGGIWMLFLPESPRWLADTNRRDEALGLLAKIHNGNGGKGEFKIKKLIVDEVFVVKTANGEHNRSKELFLGVLKDLKLFISKSYAVKSSLILFVFFANMAAGFGLNMWIPELLLRMQGRDCSRANPVSMENRKLFQSINNTVWKEMAPVYEYLTKSEIERVNHSLYSKLLDENAEQCDDTMSSDVFISGLIVGACCVLGNIACALLCSRGGAQGVRRAASACTLACAVACACLAAFACSCVGSNNVAVAAAAALNAASLNGNVLIIRLLLHALPPKLSGLGVCWGAWWGRAGGVASNLAVGVLLDYSCPAPFIAVSALLAISIGAIMMIKLDETQETPKLEEHPERGNDVQKNVSLDRYISTHM